MQDAKRFIQITIYLLHKKYKKIKNLKKGLHFFLHIIAYR